jgi:4-hydroxybenzoate polyprenyltransferase
LIEKARYIYISMRSSQWYKNAIVFLAIIFSARFLHWQDWGISIAAFVVFCLLSGGTYLLNDIIDRNVDSEHPRKCRRPISSGELTVVEASVAAVLAIAIAIAGAWFINRLFFASAAGYLALQLVYTYLLKRWFLVDIIAISIGFVLRAIAGAVAIDVSISHWLIICTFLVALVLSLAKRNEELSSLGPAASQHRNTLGLYDVETISYMLTICTAALFVSYLLYASSFANTHMLITVPFATYGIFRYLYIVRTKNVGEQAERILLDRPIVIAMVGWVIAAAAILALWK